jgi:hypothetical protein
MKRIRTVLLLFSSLVAAELFCMEKRENGVMCNKKRPSERGEEYQRIYQRMLEGMSKKDESGENESELDEFITAEVGQDRKKSRKVALDAIFDAILTKNQIAIK